MESTDKETQGDFLKIDTVWSQAEENLEIKEEIISDVEPDYPAPTQNPNVTQLNNLKRPEEETNLNSSFCSELLNSWQAVKKKIKSRGQNILPDCGVKSSCLHDTTNFKIVKRRLRCGGCRSLVCPECCKIMASSLQNHFLGSDMNNGSIYSCKMCGIPFNSLCALQAHIRIHTMDMPYVCPDCGLIYNNIYFLILHLINKCFHVYKIVRYKCKNCPGAYFTSETFVQHIEQLHIETVFRCLYCSSLFSSPDEFYSHMENVHKKQKVQYLNYFKCSLCSNMVIPKFMYQKHITQHYENSDSYEVNYKCLCNEIYSFVGGFQAHVQNCKDKGALPSYWSFLQRNLKSHETPHYAHQQSKDVLFQAVPKNMNSTADPQKTFSLLRQFDETIGGNNDSTMKNCEAYKSNFIKAVEKDSNISDTLGSTNYEEVREETDKGTNYLKLVVQNANKPDSLEMSQSPAKEHFDEAIHQESENITPNIQSEVEYPRETIKEHLTLEMNIRRDNIDDSQTDMSDREVEQIDADMSKVLYDHIPRDHLGYVIKTQAPEPIKRESPLKDLLVVEKILSPQCYQFVTELNEKTGIITTKKVPVEAEGMAEDSEFKTYDFREDMEAGNSPNVSPKFYGIDKNKFKLGNSLFTCPFCVVLFPKHGATFQQFRLHLESYHPDAALNIPVSREENNKAAPKEVMNNRENNSTVSITVENAEIDKSNENEVMWENSIQESSPKASVEESGELKKSTEDSHLENLDKEKDDHVTQEVPPSNLKTQSVFDEDGKENLNGETNELSNESKESKVKDFCWTMSLCLNEKDDVEEKIQLQEKITGTQPEESESNDAKDGEQLEILETSQTIDCLKKGTTVCQKNEGGDDKTLPQTHKSEDNTQDEIKDTNSCPVPALEESEEKPERKSSDKNSPKIPSDFEEEGDTSNHSNWSTGSGVEYISGKDARESPVESKAEKKERSRRESEVWSEFYESLMLAEKLKKKKPQLEDNNKKSVVSDYSAKRIVKKPKRYRESSESGDSIGGEYSDNDDIFPPNHLIETFYFEEKGDNDGSIIDDQLQKRQKLLRKLQNADNSFLDYLCNLVSKKEKYFELYKKHSSLRTNQYSQDLRSYRKKVLNGIKHRGRPHKVLKYHGLIKKSDLSQERNSREMSGQRTYSPKKESLGDNKPSERKRGRPRKMESARLKERRRSDKEVDFIEKNFERDESDVSPTKRKRKLSSKLQYYKKINLCDEKDDFSSGQVISNRTTDSSKKFCCAVCKENFPDFTEFREHILVHRMEENTYQCMECGECFVVRPSLEKHLHAFHKIKNTDKYIKDNHCFNIKKEAVEVESEPLKENQCKVCKDQFDRAIDLTKHFRIHGMAFLKEFKKEGKSK